MTTHRARRALMFVPGDSRRKLEKAAASGADTVILDMEDGVALSQKAAARAEIHAALASLDFGRSERLVRVNGADTPFFADDLPAALAARPDGLLLPKVNGPEAIIAINAIISAWEAEHGLTPNTIVLLAMAETALAIANIHAIAASVRQAPRLAALIFGAEDLAGDMGAVRTPGGIEAAYARGAVVLHAKAYGLDAVDMVYTAYKDAEGLAAESAVAAGMGYTGKQAIHPDQVPVIHAAFTPDDSAVARASAIVAAHEAHQATGTGAFAFEGAMIDMPVVRAAQAVLARALRR